MCYINSYFTYLLAHRLQQKVQKHNPCHGGGNESVRRCSTQ